MFEHYSGNTIPLHSSNILIAFRTSSYQPSEIIEKCTEAKDMLERWKQVR